MSKKKNYLSNAELREEILKCISDGFDKAVANGFDPSLPYYDCGNSESEDDESKTIKIGYVFNSDDEDLVEKYNLAIKNGYVPERSYWIRKVREFDKENPEELIKDGGYTSSELKKLELQMAKPVVSDKLAKMFQLIVENIARSFYWSNPDDGEDCNSCPVDL